MSRATQLCVSPGSQTCVADAVRRASEGLSPRPLSNVWEEGVCDAIFTGDMTKWLDVLDSFLHRLAEPPDFLADEVPELQQNSKRQRVMNRTFSKVTAADHDETWQESRQEQLEAQPKSVQQFQSFYNVCCKSGRGFCFDLGFSEYGSESSAAKGQRSNMQQILSSSAVFAAICRR